MNCHQNQKQNCGCSTHQNHQSCTCFCHIQKGIDHKYFSKKKKIEALKKVKGVMKERIDDIDEFIKEVEKDK